jgi:hypothetical protein
MGKKPAVAWTALVLTGLVLSGCECPGWRPERRLGTEGTGVPQASTAGSASSTGWNTQPRTPSANPFDSTTRVTTPANQAPSTFDPGSAARPMSPSQGYPSASQGNSPSSGSLAIPSSNSPDRSTAPGSRPTDDPGTRSSVGTTVSPTPNWPSSPASPPAGRTGTATQDPAPTIRDPNQ